MKKVMLCACTAVALMFGFEAEGMKDYDTPVGIESQTLTAVLDYHLTICNRVLPSIRGYSQDKREIQRCLEADVSKDELEACGNTVLEMHRALVNLLNGATRIDGALASDHPKKGTLLAELLPLYEYLSVQLQAIETKYVHLYEN